MSNEDQTTENGMKIKDSDLKQMAAVADKTIAAYIVDLPKTITTTLNRAVYSLLGLTDSWGSRLSIDHCNGNRSFIINIIDNQCRTAVVDKIEPVVTCALDMIVQDKEALAAIAKESSDYYRRALSDAVRKKLQEAAEAKAAQVVAALNDVDLGAILPINTDIEDPESFQTDLGKIMMEELARRSADGQKIPKFEKVGKTIVMKE